MTIATIPEAINEFAWGAGEERRDIEWLLSDYDCWVRNPHYRGAPTPHPEDAADALADEADAAQANHDDGYDHQVADYVAEGLGEWDDFCPPDDCPF